MAWILGTSPQLALNLLNGKLEKLSNLPNLPEMDLQLQERGHLSPAMAICWPKELKKKTLQFSEKGRANLLL